VKRSFVSVFALGTAVVFGIACGSSAVPSEPAPPDAAPLDGASPDDASPNQDSAVLDATLGDVQGPVLDAGADGVAADAQTDAPDAADDAAADANADVLDAGADASDASDAADAAKDSGPPPAPAVRYVGRFVDTDPLGPRAAWPGARAIVRFDGTGLDATLALVNGFSGGPGYLDVIVDGIVQPNPIKVPQGTSNVTVANGLPAGVHTVELVKRTEANHGVVQFRGFAFPNGGQLLAPPAAPPRRIEVMGNSTISGYGVDGAGPNCPGGTTSATFNARKSAGQVAATALGADLVLLAYGGKGVTKNLTNGDANTMPVLFDRTLPESAAFQWSFAKYVPDAFVMVVTNLDAETSEPTLTNAYEAFAIKLRAAYPNAHIMFALSAAATDDYPVGLMTRTRLRAMTTTVVSRRAAAGDLNLSKYAMTEYVNGQLTGCDYHPNEALHAQMGAELAGWLKAELGWQ
jgi:hypothetical protein